MGEGGKRKALSVTKYIAAIPSNALEIKLFHLQDTEGIIMLPSETEVALPQLI